MITMRNYLRKRLQSDRSKGHLLRLICVGVISMILILCWLYYAGNSKHIPFTPTVLTSDGKQDIFVRSTGPRVVIFIMSDKVDNTLCYSVGSAYLSGLPVVVAGYQMPFRGFLSKYDFMKAAIENVELESEDVIIVLDSDTFFTGVDINPFLDRFIAQSAATPEELDALPVRQGRAMAPLLVTGETACYAPHLFHKYTECPPYFEDIYTKVRTYVSAHPEYELALPFDLVPQRHLNSGVTVARVWAYKELVQKAVNLTTTQTPPIRAEKGWYSDQSVLIALYLDLITWEVERDVFSMPFQERQAARSPYGVRAGFIGLDFLNEFSISGLSYVLHHTELDDELWLRYLPGDRLQHLHSHHVTDKRNTGQFVVDLYKRAYTAYGDRIFTRRAVPRWLRGRRAYGADHIILTPPLFALKLRPIDTVGNTTQHTFPVLFHSPGCLEGYTKVKHMEDIAISAGWLLTMALDAKVKHQVIKYLESTPLLLSTNNSIIQDSYHAKCGFPFGNTIKKLSRF